MIFSKATNITQAAFHRRTTPDIPRRDTQIAVRFPASHAMREVKKTVRGPMNAVLSLFLFTALQ